MNINTDINILGSFQDLSLIIHFWAELKSGTKGKEDNHILTSVKTGGSFTRLRRAINGTLLKCKNSDTKDLIYAMLSADSVSDDTLVMLFWNASQNNDLINFLNTNVFFPAFYSGRLIINTDDAEACIKELREKEEMLKEWSAITIHTVSYKYLTLLSKFNLLEGKIQKKILHPYLSDKMFVLFLYWMKANEEKPNILESEWLKYSFCEQPVFLERVMQKKFADFYEFTYTVDQLKIDPLIPYKDIYHACK